jgi:hypothetical protein
LVTDELTKKNEPIKMHQTVMMEPVQNGNKWMQSIIVVHYAYSIHPTSKCNEGHVNSMAVLIGG